MTSNERRAMHGQAIRGQRALRRMRQAELAALIGSSQAALSRYESGHQDVPERLQRSIALVFGIDVDRLFPWVRVDDRPLARSA